MKIEKGIIKDWSFSWNTVIMTIACVSLLWEEVSERRKKASVLVLLTTRNAVHKYFKDNKVDSFGDLI